MSHDRRVPDLLSSALLIVALASTAAIGLEFQGGSPAGPAAAASRRVEIAEVRTVDRTALQVTLRIGEIDSLSAPATSLAFAVREPRLLESVRVGERVRFQAETILGRRTITRMEVDRG